MSSTENFDVIIIGSGQAGDPLARAAARAGRKTAIIEKAAVGGTCINYGCTPTKTMVASGRTAYVASRGALFGVDAPKASIDMVRIRERKRAIVKDFSGGTEYHLTHTDNLELIKGLARFTDASTVSIALTGGGERILTAPAIVVNTGCRSSRPNIAGIENVPYLDSTSIMELDAVPEHLVILGGGYIGVEFGQLMRRLGSRVTIVQRAGQLLGREDGDIAAEVLKILTEDGIDVILNATAKSAERTADGVRVTIAVDGEDRDIDGSHLLAATGRTPNTDDLGADAAGLELDKHGFVKSNDRLETNVPGIYTSGDVKGGPMFTHISYDDYRILKRRLLEGDTAASIAGRLVPYTVFMDPQLARVGMGEDEARAAGKNIKVAQMPMTNVARALEIDEARGLVKAIVDADTGQILGCTVLGYEGGELMAVVEVAMMGKLPYTALRDAIFAHPTSAELFNNLFAET